MPECPMTQNGGFSERAVFSTDRHDLSLTSEHFNSRDPETNSREFDDGEIECEVR